jgi:G3E family GTPase
MNAASSTPSIATPVVFTRWRWISERALPLTRRRPVRPQLTRERGARSAGQRDHRLPRRRQNNAAEALLTTTEGKGTAVVVNEFGATGIDDALVRPSADETVLLGNGCLCCIARSDLQQALRRMVIERERGELPDFRRIVIETSGLADPSPILQTFATDRALGSVFHVETVVTVVDAVTGTETLRWSAEARKQAILADRLIITKTDIAGEGASATLSARLRALNPGRKFTKPSMARSIRPVSRNRPPTDAIRSWRRPLTATA